VGRIPDAYMGDTMWDGVELATEVFEVYDPGVEVKLEVPTSVEDVVAALTDKPLVVKNSATKETAVTEADIQDLIIAEQKPVEPCKNAIIQMQELAALAPELVERAEALRNKVEAAEREDLKLKTMPWDPHYLTYWPEQAQRMVDTAQDLGIPVGYLGEAHLHEPRSLLDLGHKVEREQEEGEWLPDKGPRQMEEIEKRMFDDVEEWEGQDTYIPPCPF